MLIASSLILALPTSQLVLMLLSFAGMFGFAGVAAWLGLRQRRALKGAPPAVTAPQSGPAPQSGSGPALESVSGPTPARVAPEPAEVTEFVALPGQREVDSPQVQAPVQARGISDGETDHTAFIPAPHGFTEQPKVDPTHNEPEDRTEFVAPFGVEPGEDHTAFVPAPPPQREVKRTEFLAAPDFSALDPAQSSSPIAASSPPQREVKRTEFIPAPDFSTPGPAQPPAPSFASPSPAPPTPNLAPPVAARTPSRTIAPSAAPSIGSGLTAELAEHFELAVATLTAIEQSGAGQPAQFDGHLEVLASAPAEVLVAHLQATLASPDPAGSRHAAAWLALLHHKVWPAKRELPGLLAKLEPGARHEALRVLASWDDPRASSLAAAGLAHSEAEPEARREWLELFASCGWDPGDAAIEQALDSSHPGVLIAGLRLAESRPPAQVRAKVSAQLFALDLDVRIAAIEAALVFGEQSAWLVCRQLARNPLCPRASELVGLLGSADELAQLAAAVDANRSASLLWALGLAGRPAALEPCAAALDDHELRVAAAEALTLASGREFSSSADARAWIGSQSAARLIGGAARSLDSIAGFLASSTDLALRSAIARELRVRGSGRVLLTPELRPQAWRQQLRELAKLAGQSIDLDRDFPWHG